MVISILEINFSVHFHPRIIKLSGYFSPQTFLFGSSSLLLVCLLNTNTPPLAKVDNHL